ncbi:uncharacterized protein CMU_019970 [Cryptosporidium muris RN66]|uniref:Dynein light intermediate chain n=1 Tax=Cryptosporidium muris (strain RN66) TaxID=441375 RepID=B6AJB6_CRYMR|nr:uncharacterized protein CMU_019970 [Cryptosporidium muris RN66]EEA08254.1 hypothetical protein, conserved [Cryptosporidium muris RN66]|eukprot:XP_002142603.1 hypothetical protein [Cryptosporidium muris RN66]
MRKQSSVLQIPRNSRAEIGTGGLFSSGSMSKYNSRYFNMQGSKIDNTSIWQDILQECIRNSSNKRNDVLHGSVFVFGRTGSGKQTLINELKDLSDIKSELNNNKKDSKPYIGLSYECLKISRQLIEDELIKYDISEDSSDISNITEFHHISIDIWSIDHIDLLYEIVKRLVNIMNKSSTNSDIKKIQGEVVNTEGTLTNEDVLNNMLNPSIPNLMFLVVLDTSVPWTLTDDLTTWLHTIQDIWSKTMELSNSSPYIQNQMINSVRNYLSFQEKDLLSKNKTSDTSDSENRIESNKENDKLNYSTTPEINLGIPICLILSKSDIGQRFTVPPKVINGAPFIPFSLAYLMNMGNPYGLSYFCTYIQENGNIRETQGIDLLFKYILHRLFDFPLLNKDGSNIKTIKNIEYNANTISCVFPLSSIELLPLKPLPDVANTTFESSVLKSDFINSNLNDDSELTRGLTTAFNKSLPSLSEFLEKISNQIPQVDPLSATATNGIPPSMSTNSTATEESTSRSTVLEQSNEKPILPSTSNIGQRLKPNKLSHGTNNSTISSDPSLRGFFQNLIQRGDKRTPSIHKTSHRGSSSYANLQKESASPLEENDNSKESITQREPVESQPNSTDQKDS